MKKRYATIRIDNCLDCPFHTEARMGDEKLELSSVYCNKNGRFIVRGFDSSGDIVDRCFIPSWCKIATLG
jgi:hypothetical protein